MAFPLGVAAAIAVANIANSLNYVEAISRYVAIAALALLIATRELDRWALAILRTTVAVGALTVLVAPYTNFFVRYLDEATGELRSGGLMGHPNFAAYVMSFTLLYIVLTCRVTILMIAECALLLAAILSSGSLAAALTAAAAWGLSLVLRPTLRGWALAVAAATAAALLGSVVLSRLMEVGATGRADSLLWRQIQWEKLLSVSAGDRLFGIGWQQSGAASGNGLGAHSAYVQALVETGAVGCLLMVVGATVAFSWVHRSTTAAVLTIYCAVASLTDPVAFYPSCLTALIVLLTIEYRRHPHKLKNMALQARLRDRTAVL